MTYAVLKEKSVPIKSKMPGYYFIKENNCVLCTTPRCASSSMHKAVHGKPVISTDKILEIRDNVDVIIFFRNPLERLASAFRILHEGKSFGEFIEHIYDHWNRHWVQQTEMHTYKDVFLPTITYRFEDLNTAWYEEFSFPLPHLKNFKRQSWKELVWGLTPEQVDLANDYYKDDLDLYRKISVYI